MGLLTMSIFSQNRIIDLEKDNPSTLIGATYSQFRIFGLSADMTHDEAWARLNKESRVFGEVDPFNPERIHVYSAESKKALLYLVWNDYEEQMLSITVFVDCKEYLSTSFKRLLTFEVVDNNSNFRKNFLGNITRTETIENPFLNERTTDYYYDNIGIRMISQRFGSNERVIFIYGRHINRKM